MTTPTADLRSFTRADLADAVALFAAGLMRQWRS
jgi:hypothetical protein